MRKLPPVIEIVGPWLHNKGDSLNLWAVADRLGPSATLAVSTTLGLPALPPRPALSRIAWMPGTAALARAARSPRALARVCRDAARLGLMPRRHLRARGVAPGRDIAALLDCSGFAYADSWPARRVEKRAAYYARVKRQGSRIVLLPQAFGPFESRAVRDASRRLFDACDLIYARDTVSVEHLAELGVESRLVGVAPDITHLVPGPPPADRDAWRRRVCIVPNTRMLDRTASTVGDRYRRSLVECAHLVPALGLEPCLLLHETYDLPLAREIRDAAGLPLPIVNEDALVSKGIIGASFAVIGARYHALVSALSQGVPAIGTSWSHKYDELFAAYGCSSCLLPLDEELPGLQARVCRALAARDDLAACLSTRAAEHKAEVARMWGRIEAHLGLDAR